MHSVGVREKLEALLSREFPKLSELDDAASFVDTGAIDSADTLALIDVLETEFKIQILDEDLKEENIGSKAAIHAFLEGKLG
jgi:acyl carrier protein